MAKEMIYVCEYCRKLRPDDPAAGKWSQAYLDEYHAGDLDTLNKRHRELWPNSSQYHSVRDTRKD